MAKQFVSRFIVACNASLFLLILNPSTSATPNAHLDIPPIHHVFGITLENKNFSATFGPGSDAPYLARRCELRARCSRSTTEQGIAASTTTSR